MKLKGLSHVALVVPDLDRSIEFYQSILGFSFLFRDVEEATGHELAMLSLHDLTLELVKLPPQLSRPTGDGVVEHIAIDVEDIQAAHAYLKQKGVVFDTEEVQFAEGIFNRGCYYIMFRGPDGEYWELLEWVRK